MALRVEVVPEAADELVEAARYYAETSPENAARFRQDFTDACSLLAAFPRVGSLRFAYLLEEHELRTWSLRRFPFRLFYVEDGTTLRVLAVEHERREPASPHARLKDD